MEAIAEFDFDGRADDELSFNTGTLLLITDTGHDENWFKAVLHGSEGYIPKNYVKFTLPCWFWRHASRGEAEKLLTCLNTPVGAFCVRRSESVQGAYSLSVKNTRENVQHYKILPDKEGRYYIWLKKFKSLDALVDYYRTHSITTNSTLFLKDPPIRMKSCKALFDFTPLEEGELMLKRGQEVHILDDTDPNWWRGTVDGKSGMFPANYVTTVE
ncbi:hypothetical protein ACHWQZ_G013956 [Mnemiopsis leidyi]